MTNLKLPKLARMVTVLTGVLMMTASAEAANHYVRQGATGSGSGSDWTNACTGFAGACAVSGLVRGDTYYVANGSYGSLTLDRAASGTSLIAIKKATVADHGTSIGWGDTFGNGQASFGELLFGSDYWLIDGQTRNESSWPTGSAYGFRVSQFTASTARTPGVCASHLTARYLDIGGSDVGNTFTGSEPNAGFYIGGFDEFCVDWTLQRNFVHNTIVPFHMNGTTTGLIEYNWLQNSWGKEAIRGQIGFGSYTIRYNVFKNACQMNPTDGTSGCTAEIAIWDGSSFSNNEFYGNTIWKTTNENNSGGAIVVGGNGSSWVGPSASNTLVYNNTIAGIHQGTAIILINGGSGNIARNNLWYDVVGTPSATATTTSNNVVAGSSPFVDYTGGNFRLRAATSAGVALSSPYNTDLNGTIRGADGVWDLGALEFGGAATTAPATPTNLHLTFP